MNVEWLPCHSFTLTHFYAEFPSCNIGNLLKFHATKMNITELFIITTQPWLELCVM